MQALNLYRAYNQTGEHAAHRPTARPPRADKINIVGTDWFIGTAPFMPFITPFINGSCLPKVDAELRSTLRRVVSDGYNGICLRSATDRTWTESALNWGTIKYKTTDPEYATISNRTLHEEAALVQLDKMVAWGLDEGLEFFYIDIEAYDEITERGPNQRPLGTYQSRGMQWSDEWRNLAWDFYWVILNRVNTITGNRYYDEPRIIWKFNNEASFSHAYLTKGTATWSGSTAQWVQKIVDGTTDTGPNGGANGYWYTELNAKLLAWAASPTGGNGWTVPNWGRGSSGIANGVQGFPNKSVLIGWVAAMTATIGAPAAQNDHDLLIKFVAYMDYEYVVDLLTRLRALRSDIVVCTGTWTYLPPQCHIGLPPALQSNVFAGKHHYFDDADGTDNKEDFCHPRKSVMDVTWGYAQQGGSWYNSLHGAQSSYTATLDEECGQYSPSRWYYQRMAYQALLSCFHGRGVSDFSQSQQYLATAFYTDGRFSGAEHVGVANLTHRLIARAVAPIIKFGFFSRFASVFQIYSNAADVLAYQVANNAAGFEGNRLWPSYSGISALNAHWGGKRILWDLSEVQTPTRTSNPSFTGYPSVSEAARNAGYDVVNSGYERVQVKNGHGAQAKSRYCNMFIDTITASPLFTMPMSVSSMSAAVSCAFMCLRSDTKVDLFTGPMKLYIFGSQYDSVMMTQSGLGGAGGTEADYMANDGGVVNYYSRLTWINGGDKANARMPVPEAFTVSIDTTLEGLLPGTDLEIFGVTMGGVPVRLDSSYNSGTKVWTWRYDPGVNPYVEYGLQPKVSVPARPVRGMMR